MLFEEVQYMAKQKGAKKLLSKMPYQREVRLQKTIDKFLEFKTMYAWLERGGYDLVLGSRAFFIALATALDYKEDDINKALEEVDTHLEQIERFRGSYIFIDTQFKRKQQPIFALAMLEGKRRISLYAKEEFLYKSTEAILEMLSDFIKDHFAKNSEGLPIWGSIHAYQVHLFDKTYVFDTEGRLQQDKEPTPESLATLRL